MSTAIAAPPSPKAQTCPQPGDGYAFLNWAIQHLQRNVADHHTRLMAIREYLSLHLVQPARELMNEWNSENSQSAELCSLRQVIQRLVGKFLPWSRFQSQFENNLKVLEGRGVTVGAIRHQWELSQHSHQVFIDRNGSHQVRRQNPDESYDWMFQLANHRAGDDARPLPDDIKSQMPGPYLFDGLGFGRFFERIHAATINTFLGYSCALYVVEPDTAWLAILLHLNDWTTLLSDPRVLLYFGEDCLDQLRRAWDADVDLPWPQSAFSAGPASGESPAVRMVRQAGTAREKTIRDSLAEIEEQYATRDIGYWATRFGEALSGSGKPLRILAAVSTHTSFLQHSMRDARRALEALGHEVRVLTEDRPFTIIGPLTYHKAIRDFNPDVFFMFDHLRPECASIIPRNLPILTWDQDQLPHVFTPQNLAKIAPHDFIVGCSKFHCVTLGCNPRQLLNARVPTCPEQFSGHDLTDEELAKYTCDVSYVSHASQTPAEFHDAERASYSDPAIPPFLDVMYELLPEQLARYRVVDGGVMSAVFEEACRRRGVTQVGADLRARLCGWYLWRLGDRMFRHEALEWVGAWAARTGRTFRIYGNGWEKHPSLSAYAAGPAQNGRELLCVYRASQINLQLMPAGFVHQRSLDGLAAGGFFLGRYVPDDLKGRTLQPLIARIDELGFSSTDQLLAHPDEQIKCGLRDYVGERLNRIDHHREDLLTHLRVNAELIYPDTVFPDFASILFDSAGQFEQRAEHYLANPQLRREITARMREAVIEHYSYIPTMKLFLAEMKNYLQTARTPSPLGRGSG